MTAMPDLFGHAAAKARRDAGLKRASSHARSWSEEAFAAIERIARSQPSVHVDDVLAAGLLQPPHPNAWGAVWMRAIRAGIIARTNETRPCTADPKKRAHRYPVYESLLWRRA